MLYSRKLLLMRLGVVYTMFPLTKMQVRYILDQLYDLLQKIIPVASHQHPQNDSQMQHFVLMTRRGVFLMQFLNHFLYKFHHQLYDIILLIIHVLMVTDDVQLVQYHYHFLHL